MPHKCMECKNLIESGAIDLKSGCPICGGKKFQYVRPRKEKPPSPTVAEYVAQATHGEPRTPAVQEPPAPAPVGPPDPREDKPEGERIESIRIIEPGTYDINLPVLLSRSELVMSKEEGTYVVDLSSALKSRRRKGRKAPRKRKR